ncbi:hypothetical protein A4X09_0g1271 [Tilletia walkeri]|uniref:Uncharacterized protein n=1 Tax=Tilletia walkeri TaxID=117179 RepID=A0A8X7T880_9BASI|nr:hypothetical protein A4X09_0g1271 [Tilletia walkeri]
MQTRGYLAALVAALVVLVLQLWTMRQAGWIIWTKESPLVLTSVQYGPMRTCSKLVVHFGTAEKTVATLPNNHQLGMAAAVSATGTQEFPSTSGLNASTYPTYTGDLLATLSDKLAHPQDKNDGWVCRPFPQTDKDCNSEGDRAFCNAFLSAGYSLQFSGVLLVASMISSLLTIFSHSAMNKVEGYRVVAGLLGAASVLAIVAFAIAHDAYKNDWPYLWGASLSLGAAFWVQLVAWLVGILSTVGLLTVGFKAERGARTGSAPVDGYTRV